MLAGPYVINLAHRKDRYNAIKKQFTVLGIPIKRVDAVYMKEDGASGCMISHINALKDAPADAAAVWICEDDCRIEVSAAELQLTIAAFMASSAEVLCLGFNSRKEQAFSSVFDRTLDNQTRTAYVVKASIRPYLITLWETVLDCRQHKTEHPWKPLYLALPIHNPEFERGDQCWKILQQDHVFVIPKKRLATQIESFSDIEKTVVSYNC
jgi:hypothetical protein